PARGAKPLANAIDFRFALSECGAVRMDRVVAQHERVWMLDRRSQDERCVTVRLQLDGATGFFENGELPFTDRRGRTQVALVDREPSDGVPFGRRVAPALPVRQADVKIVDACGGANRAAGPTVASENHAHRSVFLHRVGRDVLTFRRSVLLGWRQRYP